MFTNNDFDILKKEQVQPSMMFKYNKENDSLLFLNPKMVKFYRNSYSLFDFIFEDDNSDMVKMLEEFKTNNSDIKDFDEFCNKLVSEKTDISDYKIYNREETKMLNGPFRIMTFTFNGSRLALIALESVLVEENKVISTKLTGPFVFKFKSDRNEDELKYLMSNVTFTDELNKHHWRSSDSGETFICLETNDKLSDYDLKIHKPYNARCPICGAMFSKVLSYSEELNLKDNNT